MQPRTVKQTTRRAKMKTSVSTPAVFTPAIITTIEATAADTIQITFATRVQNAKLPGYTAGAGGAETVESITAVSDTVMVLVFTGDVQGTDMIVKGGDPGIRTGSGGFVPAGSYAIPTFP